MTVERAFVSVQGRQVHYRRVGSGPPALFLHSSPTNSGFVVDDMLAQADRFTCFAFDTPGFGLSDPLPGAMLTVADLAAATAATVDALGIGPLPVYGTHTGAAIALELGYRHPDKVTGVVLDAVPIFTKEEVSPWGDNYFAPLVVDILGGHFAATWTRFRDQSIWFPWCYRTPDNLNEYDLMPPASIHAWLQMFFAAAPYYKAAYPAAVRYCDGAIEAAAGLTVPAVFTASVTDMLNPHLERLPPLRDGQQIIAFGTDPARKHRITAQAFQRFGSPAMPAPLIRAIEDGPGVKRQFVDVGGRAQMVRHAGDRSAPAVLLLHDAPGSSLMETARIAELAAAHFVLAPDLPGSGESETLGPDAELHDYAAAIWRLCDALGLGPVAIEGHGFGASLAVQMAAQQSQRARSVAIDGLLLADDDEREALLAHYAPPVTIERDGAHWYRLWLMLRDGLVYWPWYDTRRAALRRAPVSFDAQMLHDRTVETMKQGSDYHHFVNAALRHDAARALAACTAPVFLIGDPAAALGGVYGERLAELLAARIRQEEMA
jgi:pimeloyl-ACP methyl ester carboxylesterase